MNAVCRPDAAGIAPTGPDAAPVVVPPPTEAPARSRAAGGRDRAHRLGREACGASIAGRTREAD
jgi:hypothetical protein